MLVRDDLPPLREVIAAHGLSAKKSLGQNFLLDLNLTRRIARAAQAQGALVYEVGPGPGGLTRALLAEGAARVIAVERDERCLAALAEIAGAYPGRLEIVAADALALDEVKLLRERGENTPVRVAANLPYNIGTALLVKWLTADVWPPFWSSLTLMFQREVAERIAAQPGTHAYGRLSVLAQWRARAKILFDVSKSAFVPPPKVTSAVVRIEPLREPVAAARLRDLEAVTAVSFGQRRKMLRHSLKTLTQDAEALIRETGIDPVLRPEQLSVAEFASLARAWAKRVEKPISHVRE
ncbi:MAG: 16S rRNA (adenine(1518)-N(6)/adenine(1519)-N(6))-dimethyltransferase RsmA [Alphaproteobacteria bacterium]|nr:16S rRNA (adenine(1518)-N(6)/adenine(1519)-N(6))-dimethyltransferase RsmA [Alphaproteobacteria bacterium]MDE2630157.1 16S rRNA (adenine(1518)-N(6)/adenine(1519)-N(6))-dimethyltransferase RsmA [Alphaproteobacteria bacterium]